MTNPRSARAGNHRMPLAVVLGLMLLAGLGALLALNTASAAQELRQRSLTDSNATTSDTAQQLLRDLAQKQAPAALASAATAMGLIPNSNPAFLQIHSNGSVSVLGQPAPASVAPKPTPTPTAKPTPTPTPTPIAKPTPTAKPSTPVPAAAAKATVLPKSSVVPKPTSAAIASGPVVTVTVTKPAPAASPTPSPR